MAKSITARHVAELEAENAKLREQMERLVTLLRVDCDIDASWDGLRRFWSIGLTESGCLMRDRACKAEAENEKLRELAERAWKIAERICQAFDGPCRDDGVTIHRPCPLGERDEECVYGLLQRDLRELGIEVDA